MNVIEIEGLRKVYRSVRGPRTVAVDGLDLAVRGGGVFGFLGPNGSGKTTTIRCLLGLVRPSAGGCRILGAESGPGLHRVVDRIGTIVEEPAPFPGFSGRRNLMLLARAHGIGASRVAAVLGLVGLDERAGDLVKTYSLGMRQRLGLAAALLKDPEVLVLDEPANGLDPAGIKEVRDLLRGLGREGRTVFVSSHILSEVRQMCDEVVILARGRRVAGGRVDDVLRSGRTAGLVVRIGEPERARAVLAGAGFTAEADRDALRVAAPLERAAEVTKALADAGLYLTELRPDEADLETVFLELTDPER